jgi:hypothetical protein
MASEIGIVTTLIGEVSVIDITGTSRVLQSGDKVFQNDLISTGTNAAVEISLEDGNVIDIARNSQVLLDENVNSELTDSSNTDDIELIQQALLDGNDPTEAGEATAAGSGAVASDSGSSFVFVARSDEEVIPTSGFDTSGIATALPDLLEEQEFDLLEPGDSEPNSIPTLSTGLSTSTSAEFTVTNYDRGSYLDAGYRNSYGYYVKSVDSAGNITPTTGMVLENDVQNINGGPTSLLSNLTGNGTNITVEGYTQDQIGYFLIPDGGARNSTLVDESAVVFNFINGQWQAFLEDGTPLSGAQTALIFDDTNLNLDSNFNQDGNGLSHVQPSTFLADVNQAWEDLPFNTHPTNSFSWYSDSDYDDVNMNVDWTSVTATGDVLESVDFGVDSEASIDFTLESVSPNGTLTSYGKDITFRAVDTDSDGFNDQIIGSTDDRDVLTLDGILEGDYSLSVLDAIDDNQGDSTVGLVLNVSATDNDGDVGNAILNINLNIDANQLLSSVVNTDAP